MRRRRHLLQVSTFPFLAVLLCAMGSLILLLLVMDRRARAVAQAKAFQAAARLAAADAEAEARRAAELERRRRALHDEIAAQDEAVRDELGKVHGETSAMQRTLDVESAQADALTAKLGEATNEAAATETSLMARRDQAVKSAQASAESQRELSQLTAALTRLEQTLADLQKARERDERKYSLVPYKGRRGDDHKPIYVECAAERVIFHPDRTTLEGFRVSRAAIRTEMQKRIDRQREAIAASKKKGAKPYLLLLVRPDGIMTYYQAMAAVDDLSVDFGYELVEADWVFDFSDDGPAQPWTIGDVPPLLAKPAPAPPRRSKSTGTGTMRLGYAGADESDGHGVDNPKSPGPMIGGRGGAVSPGAPNSATSPGSNSGLSALVPTLGIPGNAPPGGVSDGLNATGANTEPPGSASSGAATLGLGSGVSAVSSLSNSFQPGASALATSIGLSGYGGQSPTPEGSRLGHGSGTSSGATALQESSRDPIATTGTPTPLATTGSPQREPNPGMGVTSSVGGKSAKGAATADTGQGTSEPGSESRDSATAGPREIRANAGNAPPGSSSSTEDLDPEAHPSLPHRAGSGDASGSRNGFRIGPDVPLPGSEKKTPSPPRPVVFGNRDWIITVECLADGVRVFPGGKHFTTAECSASKSNFSQALQSMIERRQAMARLGDPPYRPIVRFLVHPDGLRAYYVAYPALEALHVLMTRENWHVKPKAGE